MAVRHYGHAFDLLVVLADKLHMRGESAEVLPSGKSLRMNQHATKFCMVREIGIDSTAEIAEVLLA